MDKISARQLVSLLYAHWLATIGRDHPYQAWRVVADFPEISSYEQLVDQGPADQYKIAVLTGESPAYQVVTWLRDSASGHTYLNEAKLVEVKV